MASDNYGNNSGGTLDFAGVICRQIDRILFMACNIQTTGSMQDQVTRQAQIKNAEDMRFGILMLEASLKGKLPPSYEEKKKEAIKIRQQEPKFDYLARWFGSLMAELPKTGLLDKQAKIMYDDSEN